jgi:hypothetical protein
MEKIWFKDIKHLFTKENYEKFFPTKDMTFAEQLNAMMRFSIYFAILVFVLRKDSVAFMVPLFVGLFTFVIYTVDTQNKQHETMYLNDKKWYKTPFSGKLCQQPTSQNPFMNVLVSDYVLNPERKPACDVTKTNIKNKTKKFFDKNLYRSVSDIFNKEASDRQWITNPITTIPNDQDGFAQWCYGMNKTCKEGDGNKCYTNAHRMYNR